MDGYFPEILAADLERSSSVFALRHMTSGSPEPALSSEDKLASIGHGWPNRFPVAPFYHTSPSRPARSLGPIKEKAPMVSFISQSHQDETTDNESLAGTELSKGAGGARSNASRDRSIFTAATSLTSSFMSTLKNSGESARERSWIDPDTDDDEPAETTSRDHLAALSPRPPTPPRFDRSSGFNISETIHGPIPTRSNSCGKHFHQKSHSISAAFAPPDIPLRQSSGRMQQIGVPSGPPPPHDYGEDDEPPPIPARRRPRASTFQNHCELTQRPSTARLPTPPEYQTSTRYDDYGDIDMTDVGDSSLETLHVPADEPRNAPSPVFIRPTPPPSPLPSVEAWLTASARTYMTHPQGDDLSSAVRLPPNVMETLRISVTCFPETMLLTSSLTVETVRSYSKKVRQPTTGLQAAFAAHGPVSPTIPRKSLWEKVASYKKSPSLAELRQEFSPNPTGGVGAFGSRRPGSKDSPQQSKPWEPFKSIFGSASDYICDALWAHIIAYNYISAHVPRASLQRSASRGHAGRNDAGGEEIPKKAASLLGLAASPTMSVKPNVQRIANKLSSPLASSLGFSREGMVVEPPGRRTAAQDNAMRDLQAGLMRCIARLIATAKLMVEDEGSDGPVLEVDMSQGLDIFLARSLCEIVRVSEEELS